MPPKKSKTQAKEKKSHNDFCGIVCICCLSKIKSTRPKKVDETLSSLIVSNVYPGFETNRNFLPTVICTRCIVLVKSQSEMLPFVKYESLVENVKQCQVNCNSGENFVCELCKLGAASSINIKSETSEFLIGMRNTKKGRIPIAKPLSVTDLVPDPNKTKEEKLNEIVEKSSPTLQQLVAKVMRNKANRYYTESFMGLHIVI